MNHKRPNRLRLTLEELRDTDDCLPTDVDLTVWCRSARQHSVGRRDSFLNRHPSLIVVEGMASSTGLDRLYFERPLAHVACTASMPS